MHVPAPLLCELAVAASGSSSVAARHVSQVPDASRWVRRLLDHPDRTVRERAGGLAARMPVRPDHDLRIHTLGGLTVERSDGVEVADLVRRGRLRQLLARLVVERSVLRAQLAEESWPDLEPDQAANNLRVTLSKLLDVVEPGRQGGDAWWLRTTGDRLELVLDGLTIDADDFDRHLREARHAEANGAPSVAYDCYSSALPCTAASSSPGSTSRWPSTSASGCSRWPSVQPAGRPSSSSPEASRRWRSTTPGTACASTATASAPSDS